MWSKFFFIIANLCIIHVRAQDVSLNIRIGNLQTNSDSTSKDRLKQIFTDSLVWGKLDSKNIMKSLRLCENAIIDTTNSSVKYNLDLYITDTIVKDGLDKAFFVYYNLTESGLDPEHHEVSYGYYGRGGIKGDHIDLLNEYIDWLKFSVDCALQNIPLLPVDSYNPVNLTEAEVMELQGFREYVINVSWEDVAILDTINFQIIRDLIFNNFQKSQLAYYLKKVENKKTFNFYRDSKEIFTSDPVFINYHIRRKENGYLIEIMPIGKNLILSNGVETVPDSIFIKRSMLLNSPSQVFQKLGTGIGRIIRLNWL